MNSHTLLLRQIHPSFIHDGRLSSQAFRPTPKDEQQLSVYDGDQIQPAAAWTHYAAVLGYLSCGVVAVGVGECHSLALSVIPDPVAFPEHVLIDFSAHSRKATEKKAKELKAMAEVRGWLHRDETI